MGLGYRVIPVTSFEQNCSLVWCETTRMAALIDPGGDLPKLLAAVDAEQVSLQQIWITHGHIDHAGAVAELSEQTQCPIYGPHIADCFWIDLLPQQSQMFGLPPARIFQPDRWLQQGDRLELGEQTVEVLHCPGHTPGHLVFHHVESQLAFVGDVLFHGSIGRTDFPRGSLDELMRSIRERLLPLGDEVRFVPGHGRLSSIGIERESNPFLTEEP